MAIIVNDVTPRAQYEATASQTVFAYTFPIFEESDLKVYLTPVGQSADDTADILTLTTDYTVTGEGTTAGGDVTLVVAATAGDIITIVRDIPIKRTTDYQQNGDLNSTSFNDDLDKLVMMVQQQEDSIDNRLLKFIETANLAGVNVSVPSPVADKVIGWDSAGTALENKDNPSAAQAAAAASAAAAAASAANAATSEANAAASYDSFDDRYLGVFTTATEPTLDNDGDSLITGALYFNSDINIMKVYTGSFWSEVTITPDSYKKGLELSTATDADHDITIAIGEMLDSTGARILKLTSSIIKQIDASWSVGTNQGGLFSGTVAADTTYYVFLIQKTSDGSLDAGFDTSSTAANIPTGYAIYGYLGNLLTDASANISQVISILNTDVGDLTLHYEEVNGATQHNLVLSLNEANHMPSMTVRNEDTTASSGRAIAGYYLECDDGAGGVYNASIHNYGENYNLADFRGKLNVTCDAGPGVIIRAGDANNLGIIEFHTTQAVTSARRAHFSKEGYFILGDSNVGVEGWDNSRAVMQIGANAAIQGHQTAGGSNAVDFAQNTYFDGTNWKHQDTGKSSLYEQAGGAHLFAVTASGTADTNITWNTAFTITNGGALEQGQPSVTNTGTRLQNGGGQIALYNAGTAGVNAATFNNDNGEVGSIYTAGTGTAYNTTSDKRLKTSRGLLSNASEFVNAIDIHEYHFNSDDSLVLHGVMAQDCYEVYPNAVHKPEDPEDNWGVDYSKFVPILIAHNQDLEKRIEKLEKLIENNHKENG